MGTPRGGRTPRPPHCVPPTPTRVRSPPTEAHCSCRAPFIACTNPQVQPEPAAPPPQNPPPLPGAATTLLPPRPVGSPHSCPRGAGRGSCPGCPSEARHPKNQGSRSHQGAVSPPPGTLCGPRVSPPCPSSRPGGSSRAGHGAGRAPQQHPEALGGTVLSHPRCPQPTGDTVGTAGTPGPRRGQGHLLVPVTVS